MANWSPDEVLRSHRGSFLVAGGFHLLERPAAEIKVTADALLSLTPHLAPCHCSNPEARELFGTKFGDRFLELGVGTTISLHELPD